MKLNFKKIAPLLAFLSAGSCLFAENASLKELVNSKYYDELKDKGFVRIIHSSTDSNFVLLPENDYKEKCMVFSVEKEEGKYPFVTESLFYIPKSECAKNSEKKEDEIGINDVSVIFRSISKMQGMNYYSLNKKKEEVLYKAAYMVNNGKDRKKIADPIEGSANEKVYYCFQDDVSFGKCVYELSYFENEGTFYANFTNLDTMGFGPIKAINPGKMRINALVIDCGDSFLLYLSTDTDCIKLPGIKKTLTNSLTARMDAIYKWFVAMF
ncbi:MAG: hypothetical protein K5829_15195 [Treponema sp.]|nr:hypothetical protein [Treponema sp.]